MGKIMYILGMSETHRVLFQNERETPLGRLRLAGEITGGSGVNPTRTLRVYGSYAVVVLTGGRGTYRDSGTHLKPRPVATGDVFLVFPEHPHWYGPAAATQRPHLPWNELYLTFDGPVFDLWRQAGLLSQARPVLSASPAWIARFREFLEEAANAPASGQTARLRQLLHFLPLFSDLILPPPNETSSGDAFHEGPLPPGDWAGRARALLERDLNRDLPLSDAALAVDMGYETFRKRFVRDVGVSPAQYRAARKMEAARALLHYSPHLTNRQVAETLRFADEFHFSKQFSRAFGMSPRQFRQAQTLGAAAGQEAGQPTRKQTNMSNTVTIKRLQTAEEIAALRVLRGQVLRANQPPEAAHYPDDFDDTTYHIGAVETATGRVVGIATLLPKEGIQLRGMAVAPEWQKTGVGRLVLDTAHQVARERGLPLWCNARVSAMGFYQKAGWETGGNEFEVKNVGPHFVMRWTGG